MLYNMDDLWTFYLLRFCRFFFCIAEFFLDWIFGYTYSGGTREEREAAKLYKNSAHLVTIKWRAQRNTLWLHFKEDFIYKHDKYLHPRYILDAKHITLFTVMKDYAMFCVSDPDEDLYDTKKHPFIFISQYQTAKQLLFLPIASFHKLAEELGNPKVPVMMNHMTARYKQIVQAI